MAGQSTCAKCPKAFHSRAVESEEYRIDDYDSITHQLSLLMFVPHLGMRSSLHNVS